MAEWTDLSAGERQQAWRIFDSLRQRGPKTVDDICLTWAIPQKAAIRELSAMQDNGMVELIAASEAPHAWSAIRRRTYAAVDDVRQRRYKALLEEWDGNFVDRDSVPTIGYDVDFAVDRFVLVEESTYGNGKWITLHETPRHALTYHDSSEYPLDYDIDALIDLDTGDEYSTETITCLNAGPDDQPAGVSHQTSEAAQLAHDIAEALEKANKEGLVLGEDERLVIREVLERRGVA